MTASAPTAHEFAASTPRALDDIPGWFYWTDRAMFDAVLTAQAGSPPGHLVELGTYLGKSAVVVGAHRRSGERFVVIDLFERTDLLGAEADANRAESLRSYRSLTQQAFEHNYLTLRGELPEVVVGMSSVVVDHLPEQSVRFIHIDASHLYDAVAEDVRSAARLLRPGGVVVLDDYRSEHTPGVAAAAWEAVFTAGMVPVALTTQKLYATFSDPGLVRAAAAELVATDERIWSETQRIGGHPVVRLGPSALVKERDRRRRQAAEEEARRKAQPTLTRWLRRRATRGSG